MKSVRTILFILLIMSSFVSIGQEEALAERLGTHKNWNVAFVRELQVDSSLTINAILVQAYSNAEWDSLLSTMGKTSEQLCGSNYSGNVLYWFADRNTLIETTSEEMGDGDCFVFCRCSERTIAIFFPFSQADQSKILSSYLTEEQVKLHRFMLRSRKNKQK